MPTRRNDACTRGRILLSRVAVLLASILLASGLGGCASIPPGLAAVDAVSIEGNEHVSSGDIEEKIATAESPRFLALFQGVVFDYEIFDRGVLQRDLQRVERYYRARGYYEAKARAGRVVYDGDDKDHVSVTIEVEEGVPVRLVETRIQGLEALSEDDAGAVRSALEARLEIDEPFEEEPFHQAVGDMKRALTDRGYAYAKVTEAADVDLPKHTAKATFVVTPGPKATFGVVKVEGLKELPEDGVLQAINIDPGDDYSTETIDEAEDAVVSLGTFSSVEITPQLSDPPPAKPVVDLVVKVREQKLRSVLAGGGIQLDATRAEVHLRGGWEHKNLFGGFRNFQVDLKPALVLYPTRLPTFDAPTAALPAEKLTASLRQPGFVEARTTGFVTSEVNTYPLLLATKVVEDAPVVGFFEYKGGTGLERTFWKLFVSPSYNFQFNQPFVYKGQYDDTLQSIIVSYIDLLLTLDFRDDRIRPHKGIYLANDFQFAGLGGDARDFRVQPEVRGYVPLGSKVTLAARASVGFLFPLNYGDAARANAEGNGVPGEELTRDIELIFLRGFFSGGPSSNRGYPLRGVGPHGSVPFLNPGISPASCVLGEYDADLCGVPLGGLSLWEASLELRFPIIEPLGGAVFCDVGDVSAERLDLRFNYPHLSCGLGLRYDTPIGPIRVDVGYRIPGAQVPSDADPRREGTPDDAFGIPVAFAFGLGEAF